MARRFIMRIELTGSAKQKLAKLSDHHGMTQVSMMSRLVEWYANQNQLSQAAVMGQYPTEHVGGIANLILKQMVE